MTAKSQAASVRPEAAVEADPRWARVLARDRSADGQFWYSVATTGVYCRPSCPSRTANPRNVGLHGSLTDAKATGFRPCKRCNPDGPSADIERTAIVAKACRLIEESEGTPSLKALAQAASLSTSHFHRLFKSVTGLTPKDYAEAHQASRVRDGLARGRSVTEAMHDAGFNSSGRFYEKSRDMLGMTPTQYRAGGANEEIRFAVGQSPLGAILVASSDKGVASILIGDDPDELVRDLQDRFPKARLVGGDKEYVSMVVRVISFVEMPQIGLNLPLDVRGTAFQRRVWQALQAIAAGQRSSCSEIARRFGAPRAVRAVAIACAANNIAVAIPCNRVVRNDGALSGHAWGVEREFVAREAPEA
jgi:AraC family transcriptional regulator, regulatory protein of adaptative response / methylated-DNA-[protein]-cysteine methyltransferase